MLTDSNDARSMDAMKALQAVPISQNKRSLHLFLVGSSVLPGGCCLLIVWLFVCATLPTVSVARRGWSGGFSFAPICGQPTQVFQKLGLPLTDLPSTTQLEALPRPNPNNPHPTDMQPNAATYDPSTKELCVGSALAIDSRYINPQSQVQGSTTYQPGSSLLDTMKGLLSSLVRFLEQKAGEAMITIIDSITSLGFFWLTPAALTYKHGVVISLNGWGQALVDGALALVLIISGYQYMVGQSRGLREWLPRLLFSAVLAHFSLYFIAQFVEIINTANTGIAGVLATAGIGDLSLPWGIINWATSPEYEVLAYLIGVLVALLLSLQMLARIALLDLLIILAPLGLICFALPQTRAWGRLWAQAFVSTLIAQSLQLLCVALGSALIASFGHASMTVITILVGIAALFLAFKIPGMLLNRALRDLQGEMGHAIQTIAEIAVVVSP